MSASVSTLVSPAIALPQPGSGGNGVADALSTGTGDAGPFAALFLQALGKQVTEELPPELMRLVADAAATASSSATGPAGDTEEALDALLPFLDALGLAQFTDPTMAAVTAPVTATQPTATLPDDTATGNHPNPAASLQAMLATQSPAISAADHLPGQASDKPLPALSSSSPALSAPGLAAATEAESGFAAHLQALVDTGNAPTADHPGHMTPSGMIAAPLQPTSSSQVPTVQLQVAHPIGASGWSEEVGNHVTWMSNRMESRAELVLTPPQMGRVEVSLSVSGDQASASFVSANPAVREALEAAMPRLREILADAGIQLGQAQVGAENPRQTAQQEKNGDNFLSSHGNESDAANQSGNLGTAQTTVPLKPGRGLVDVFA